jgi:hypothetical protein
MVPHRVDISHIIGVENPHHLQWIKKKGKVFLLARERID